MATLNFEKRVTKRKAELAARKAARISGYDVGYASQRIRLIGEDLKKKILSNEIVCEVRCEVREGYRRGVEDANVDHAVGQLLKEMKKS